MTSSSFRGPGFEPFRGRLNDISGNGSWCADGRDVEPYLQIDLGNRFQISMIAIQGNEIHEFVTILKTQVNCRYALCRMSTPNIIEVIKNRIIHRMQIWRTTRSSPETSYMKLHESEVSQSLMFCFEVASPQNSCFVVVLFRLISLCLRVAVFLNATRRDRNIPPFTSRGK